MTAEPPRDTVRAPETDGFTLPARNSQELARVYVERLVQATERLIEGRPT
jgi:hypothetical protein